MAHDSYHLSYFGPSDPHWPNGGWSVYHINGDEIAQRIEFKRDERGFQTREALRRDNWCGYLGIYETLELAATCIRNDKAEREAQVARQAKKPEAPTAKQVKRMFAAKDAAASR
jgi:serine phosphatase RsbU (regulator of sigma subunit)